MGSATRSSRGKRFIEEFNEDFVEKINFKASFIESQGLGSNEGDQLIRFYVRIRFENGTAEEFCLDHICYDPDWDTDDAVDVLVSNLDISAEQARRRLDRAELL